MPPDTFNDYVKWYVGNDLQNTRYSDYHRNDIYVKLSNVYLERMDKKPILDRVWLFGH